MRNTSAILLLLISGLQGLRGQAFESSNLPIVIINTGNFAIVNEPKVDASMHIIDNGPGVINSINDPVNGYDGPIGIEYRGSSSLFLFPKKSYGIEIWTEDGADTTASILAMPEEEDWVMHGPYSDKTLMRNLLAFHLWSGTGRYGSRTRLIEFVLDGSYEGVYVMMEKIKRDNDRVDISRLNPDENTGDDLTGGYIIKLDKFDGSNSFDGWTSPFWPPNRSFEQTVYFQFDYPKGRNITTEQAAYIETYVTEFEQSLVRSEFADYFKGYRQYADVSSFIDFAILNEITKNVDGYRLSTFFYKDRDSNGGKLTMGPIWDFNLAFGNADYCEGGNPEGWAWDFNQYCPEDTWLIPFWWERFLQDLNFTRDLKARWQELRAGPYRTDAILAYIDSVASVLEGPQQRNFERWNNSLGVYIWPNNFVGDTYQQEVDYMKDWIEDRVEWLDRSIERLESNPPYDPTGLATDQGEIKVFPSPFSTTVFVTSKIEFNHLKLFDLHGRVLFDRPLKPVTHYRIDSPDLPKGIYILEVVLDSGISEKKLVIRR